MMPEFSRQANGSPIRDLFGGDAQWPPCHPADLHCFAQENNWDSIRPGVNDQQNTSPNHDLGFLYASMRDITGTWEMDSCSGDGEPIIKGLCPQIPALNSTSEPQSPLVPRIEQSASDKSVLTRTGLLLISHIREVFGAGVNASDGSSCCVRRNWRSLLRGLSLEVQSLSSPRADIRRQIRQDNQHPIKINGWFKT